MDRFKSLIGYHIIWAAICFQSCHDSLKTALEESKSKLRKAVFLRDELPEFFRQLEMLDIPLSDVEKMYQDYLQR